MQKKDVETLLAASFKELVLEKPIEKITIREITDRAGVIRVTFYNHFQDKYELIEWIMRKELMDPIKLLFDNQLIDESLTFLFTTIRRNKEFYTHLSKLEGQNSFEEMIRKCIREVATGYLKEHSKGKQKYQWLTPERAGDFCSVALCYVLISWIRSGMQETPEEMVEVYQFMTTHSMIDLPDEV